MRFSAIPQTGLRPVGHVPVPAAVALAVRDYLRAHGEGAAMSHFGLGRTALYRLAAGLIVQGGTLAAACDGLARAAP